jgi:hypothetical protein
MRLHAKLAGDNQRRHNKARQSSASYTVSLSRRRNRVMTRRWFLTALATLCIAGRPIFAVAPRYSEAEREIIAWLEGSYGRKLTEAEIHLSLKQARAIGEL